MWRAKTKCSTKRDDRRSSVDSIRVLYPLFQAADGGSNPTSALQARDLIFERCPKYHAVTLVRAWHSRMPNCQNAPWTHAFCGHAKNITFVVALWNNPSGRCVPPHWRELRRMACAPDAPKNTPSRFLGWMVRWFNQFHPEHEQLISYQDTAVHSGTIYKAAGWTAEHETTERIRDRSKNRIGTSRLYRQNINGTAVDSAKKIRWTISLKKK
jgi:hypothetical protein